MQNSGIEWTTHSFNMWRGCSKVSAGCTNCYAETLAKRNPQVLGEWGPNGTRVVAAEAYWADPLKWNRQAWRSYRADPKRHRRPRVFCASMADVFEDRPELVAPRQRLFELIGATPNLDWLMLTKRPQVAVENWPLWAGFAMGGRIKAGLAGWPLEHAMTIPNVWVGASVEDQAAADTRIPLLLKIPAAVRFLSMEPLLGPVDLTRYLQPPCGGDVRSGHLCHLCHLWRCGIHWVIVGGESGHNARPMHPDWARSLRDQCQAAGVPFFFKQWGDWAPDHDDGTHWFESREDGEFFELGKDSFAMNEGVLMRRVGKKAAGRLLDGRQSSQYPAIAGVPA